MENSFDSNAYVNQVGVDLVSAFERARSGTTPGLVGSAMEKPVLQRVGQLLPRALEAGSGCVIDTFGRTSRQIDIVIFERNLCPVFCINDNPETTYYPCEGVVAVGEIKSKVGKAEFDDSVMKMESIKRLRRKLSLFPDGDENAGCLRTGRKYGQMSVNGITIVEKHVDPRVDDTCDILTFLLTDSFKVTDQTVKSYYSPLSPKIHDVLIGLDGLQALGARKISEGNWEFTSMRLADTITMFRTPYAFAHLILRLYQRFRKGQTADLRVFEDYILTQSYIRGDAMI